MSGKNVDTYISDSLLRYRVTPHATTGEAPSVLLMGRRLRTKLDLLVPSVKQHVENVQRSTVARSEHCGYRVFDKEKNVLVRNFKGGVKWICGNW